MTKKEKEKLARLFSLEMWGWLCTHHSFLVTLDEGTTEQAKVVAKVLIEEHYEDYEGANS